MKLTSKIYLLFIGCFVPVINYGQQLYKPAHFESPRSMPIQSVPVSKTINVVDYELVLMIIKMTGRLFAGRWLNVNEVVVE